MKLRISLLLLILLQFSCKDKANEQIKSKNVEVSKVESQTIESKAKNTNAFNFEKFKISNGQVGKIKIGMKIRDAEKFLSSLTKKEVEAYDFGFDGGGKAYIYSLKNESVIALIPKRDSDELLAIVAISKNLKTYNGLNPQSTVAAICAKYPDIKVNQDIMMDWEFIQDKKSNLQFIFITNEKNQIGEYIELEIPVEPKRKNIKADWIEVI